MQENGNGVLASYFPLKLCGVIRGLSLEATIFFSFFFGCSTLARFFTWLLISLLLFYNK